MLRMWLMKSHLVKYGNFKKDRFFWSIPTNLLVLLAFRLEWEIQIGTYLYSFSTFCVNMKIWNYRKIFISRKQLPKLLIHSLYHTSFKIHSLLGHLSLFETSPFIGKSTIFNRKYTYCVFCIFFNCLIFPPKEILTFEWSVGLKCHFWEISVHTMFKYVPAALRLTTSLKHMQTAHSNLFCQFFVQPRFENFI